MKTRIKQAAVFCIAAVLVILISSPFIITWAVNTVYVKDKIAAVITQKSGLRIDSSKFSLKLFPVPGIKMNQLTFKPDDQTNVKVRSIKLNLDRAALAQGKIVLEKLIIAGPEITSAKPETKGTSAGKELFGFKLAAALSQVFEFLPRDQESVQIVISNGASEYFKGLDASLVILTGQRKLELDANIKDINVAPHGIAGPGFGKFINMDLVAVKSAELKAVADLQADRPPSCKGSCRLTRPEITNKKGDRLIETQAVDLSFELSEQRQQITVAPMALDYPSGSVGVDFFNSTPEKKAHLKFSGKNIHVAQARQMSLRLVKNVSVVRTLFDILLDGSVPRVSVSFLGDNLNNLLDEHNLELSGSIQDGKVHIPETELIVTKINGSATVGDGVLDVSTSRGIIQSSKIESGALRVDLMNHDDVPFKGEFAIDLDLAMLPETLISLLPETILSRELSGVNNISGRCKSVLNLELKTGAQEPLVHVRTNPFSAKGSYKRIPGEISIDTVQVDYEPEAITLKEFTGTINGSRINRMNAVVKLDDNPILDIRDGSGTVDIGRIIPWLGAYEKTRRFIEPVITGEGKAIVSSITLSGPVLETDKWQYKASGKIENTFLGTQTNPTEIENLYCRFQVSHVSDSLEDIRAEINGFSFIDTESAKKYIECLRTPFTIKNTRLNTLAGRTSLAADLEFKQNILLHLDLKENKPGSISVNSIRLKDYDISDARIIFNQSEDKPLFDFSGRFNTSSLTKIFKPESCLDRRIRDLTGGRPVLIHTDKDNTLNVFTPNLNLNALSSSPLKKKATEGTRQLITENLINFKAKKLQIKDLCFTDVDTKISFKKDHAYIRLKKADLCDLKTQGYINIKNNKVYADIPFKAENQDNIQTLLSCLFNKDGFMDGKYSLTCSLSADGIPARELSGKVKGILNLEAENGRIYKLTLLSRILSVLNVSSVFKGKIPNILQQGFAYKNIIIHADIKDSIIHLKEAIIDGQDMTMIFTGHLDPVADKIDLTCLVAPFKTVDLIIEKIPIVNTLLGGRLVSVPVKATGKMSDPTVIPLHPSAVGKGLIGMMSQIVKSPIILWEKMLGDE